MSAFCLTVDSLLVNDFKIKLIAEVRTCLRCNLKSMNGIRICDTPVPFTTAITAVTTCSAFPVPSTVVAAITLAVTADLTAAFSAVVTAAITAAITTAFTDGFNHHIALAVLLHTLVVFALAGALALRRVRRGNRSLALPLASRH